MNLSDENRYFRVCTTSHVDAYVDSRTRRDILTAFEMNDGSTIRFVDLIGAEFILVKAHFVGIVEVSRKGYIREQTFLEWLTGKNAWERDDD